MKKKTIDWQQVNDRGTCFFGRPLPAFSPWGGARFYAHSQAQPVIKKAEELGADGDFTRACLLHLAELAVKHDISPDTFRLSKAHKPILLSGEKAGILLVRKIRIEIRKLKRSWDKAKGMVHTNVSPADLPGERKVDEAFDTLGKAISEYLYSYGPPRKSKKTRGHPSYDDILSVLSGLDKHLEVSTGRVQRQLLFRLTGALLPRLPIIRTQDQLRSALHVYRRRKGSNGDPDLKGLEGEFDRLRN